MHEKPQFRKLTDAEIDAIVARNSHGRLAFSFRNRVDLEPIHYVHDNGWLFGRTRAGTKLATLQRSPWVAFEIDEVEDLYEWRSVVLKGTVYLVDQTATADADELREHAIEQIRRLVPAAFTDADPAPHLNVLIRIHIDEKHGRMATMAKE